MEKPQVASTEYFTMDDEEEMPVAGVRPPNLVESRPQHRVQRRTIGQIVDFVADPRTSCAADRKSRDHPCCSGASERSACSRGSCRGTCLSCSCAADRFPVVGRAENRPLSENLQKETLEAQHETQYGKTHEEHVELCSQIVQAASLA